MPKSHQKYLEWSPSRIINWAHKIGEATAKVVETILKTRRHPEQGYRSCLGILRMGNRYSDARLEAASRRAVSIGGYSYRSIKSILEKGLDRVPISETTNNAKEVVHENIRGLYYYKQKKNRS